MEKSPDQNQSPVIHPELAMQCLPPATTKLPNIPFTGGTSGEGDDAKTSVDLDRIVFDGASERWLKRNGLMPNAWNLPATEAQRILSAQIRLFVFHSPVFVLDLKPNPFGFAFAGDLICFDASLLLGAAKGADSESKLVKEEAIAFITHEIGHKLNKRPPVTDPAEQLVQNQKRGKYAVEEDADDYACQCGFGIHLANGLEKLTKSNLPYFDSEVNRARLERLRKLQCEKPDNPIM